MCHWVLRIWKCGDRSFTKFSSCSFDRAAHDPSGLLNPLHPSITPCGVDTVTPHAVINADRRRPPVNNKHHQVGCKENKHQKRSKNKKSSVASSEDNGRSYPLSRSQSLQPMAELRTWPKTAAASTSTNGPQTVFARDAKTGQTIPIPLSEVGKASRFGDKTLAGSNKCNVSA
ncbi:hypothetical protein CC80DRAFT_191473 [Byssothecium circinans]|uniref:Uncharacterized protein n=1 Tax=Byssothecium circinans TaxID=147558 RepID=A0A6A5TJ50_9PLEO|nr:hypothetical protein CC80DRAFT_191473 [Byssothecium circinans]